MNKEINKGKERMHKIPLILGRLLSLTTQFGHRFYTILEQLPYFKGNVAIV
jgi:hypothetical protein